MSRTFTALSLIALLTLSGCSSLSLPQSADAPAGKEAQEALKLARVLRDNGRLPGAYEVYQRMDQRKQLNGAYLLEYASVAAAVRPAGEAYALFDRARRELGPELSSIDGTQRQAVCTGLARAALALGNAENAERHFRCALATAPESTQALNGLGVAQTLLGQPEAARTSFTQALSLDPGYTAATNNLALSWLAAGDNGKAIGLLNSARQQGDISLHLNLALAYVLDGHDDTARRVLEESVEAEYATRILERFSATRQRIASGAPMASELLAASQHPLKLTEQD